MRNMMSADDGPSVEEFVIERRLPDEEWDEFWSRIYVDQEIKDKLVNYGVLLRQFQAEDLDRMTLSHHGVILLSGPPGTGKTSLAKGAANELAKQVDEDVVFKRIEVQHLFSGSLGDTPKLVDEAFQQVIEPARNPEYDAYQVLLLDEVESLFSSRSMLSGDTDPMDSVRAVNTALEAIDELASLPGVYLIATSNQPKAVDRAYYDRTDDQLFIGNPDAENRARILLDIFIELNDTLGTNLPTEAEAISEAVELAEGFSGRRLRKTILSAISRETETVLDPGELTYEQVLTELRTKQELLRERGSSDYINLGESPEEALEEPEPVNAPTEAGDAEESVGNPHREADNSPPLELPDETTSGSSDTADVIRDSVSDGGAEPTPSSSDEGGCAGPTSPSPDPSDDTQKDSDEPATRQAGETTEADSASPAVSGGSESGNNESGSTYAESDLPESWLDERVVIYDTTKSDPTETLCATLDDFFTETLTNAEYGHANGIEEVFSHDQVQETIDLLCLRRRLRGVSLRIGEFTITVRISYDRGDTAQLAVPSEDALPSVSTDDSIEIALHVPEDADVEPISFEESDIQIVPYHDAE